MAGVPGAPTQQIPPDQSIGGQISNATKDAVDYVTGKITALDSPSKTVNDLLQEKFKFNYLVFPNDLGQDYLGHYMIININAPTEGFSFGSGSESAKFAGQYTDALTPLGGGNQLSKVDRLRFGAGQVAGSAAGNSGFFSIPRQTRRIQESIALFMPTGLNFMTQNMYEDVFLGAAGGKLMGGLLDRFGGVGGSIASSAIGAATELGGLARNPINPGVEVVYTTTMLRTFIFRFLMAPRNEMESVNMLSIIRTLRFHSAPEINTRATGGGVGLTWIPPAEFDISFFHRGTENPFIPRINTCVLERIDVDYHPFGKYATFTNGHPVAVTVDLAFKELEVVHKQRVLQGF